MSNERKTLDQLAEELDSASDRYQMREVQHVKSGVRYRIIGLHFREHDMALCVEYTPMRSPFYNRVKFARSIEEMDFGTRFLFCGGHVSGNSELDAMMPNHFDHHKRGFDPK